MFVRVKDKSTGHEFDVPESDPRIGKTFTALSKKDYPPSPVVRRPKHHLNLKSKQSVPSKAEKSKEEKPKRQDQQE